MARNNMAKYLKMNKEALKEYVLKERKRENNRLPGHLDKEFEIDELTKGNGTCYRLQPREDFDGTYIVYLHGGGMCRDITSEQWDFILRVSRRSHAGLFIPIYPLTPEFSCRETFEMLTDAYSTFTMNYDVKRVILMGDSSGAGLALSLSLLAWKEGFRKPDQLILLSPALDTEFFDKELEARVLADAVREEKYFFNEAAKDFINTYWVKDYAVKTEYTSPFYEDYTDLCDDVILFSGVDDMFNCYAREFYRKAKQQGVNIRFFEFKDQNHNFIIHAKNPEQKKAFEYLIDVICNTYENSLIDIYPLKLMADWSKKYPELIRADWAEKFIYDNKFDFSTISTRISEYKNLLLAATYSACDSKVRRYIMEFPNCTVVNIGCRLDNMFERLDNGRIQWYSVGTHNIMSVRRSMYGEHPREKTVGRSLMDFSWIEEINCNRNQGVIFVCNDSLSYMTKNQVKSMFDVLLHKFPGAQFVFTTFSTGATICANLRYRASVFKREKRKFSVDDAQKVLGSWGSDYRIVAEEPITKYITDQKGLNIKTKIGIRYNQISYNYKLVHFRLGGEAYEIKL